MKFQVTAPQPVTTKVAGITLVDGKVTVDDSTSEGRRALAYFRRKGYRVEAVDDTPAPAPDPEGPPPAAPPARSASKADWVTYATSEAGGNRFSVEDAEKLTRDQLAEKYLGPKED